MECDHEVCNRDWETGSTLTGIELRSVLSCLVERGLIEIHGVREDGQLCFKVPEEPE